MSAWNDLKRMGPLSFQCGYCGLHVASDRGYFSNYTATIFLCPKCDQPNYFNHSEEQHPLPAPGNPVEHLPDDVGALYEEARRSVTVGAFTASILCSRKLLMNIAVSHGSAQGLTFVKYIEDLAAKGFVPPNGKAWVDMIRTKGNEATHEIAQMSQADAEQLIKFSEMLLRFIYEFPASIKP